MGLQRVGYEWVTELNWTLIECALWVYFKHFSKLSPLLHAEFRMALSSGFIIPIRSSGHLATGSTALLVISGPLFVVFQSLCHIWLFVTPWIALHQSSLSFTISLRLLKLMSIESVMPSSHLILCHPLHLLISIFPNIMGFSSESALHIRWPKYWSFSFSISPLLTLCKLCLPKINSEIDFKNNGKCPIPKAGAGWYSVVCLF